MHLEILSENQKSLLPFISQFKKSFYLVGGTAIAFQIGHRRSIDYDLFTFSKLNKYRIRQKLLQQPYKQILLSEDINQIHFLINEVKITFFEYPYNIPHPNTFDKVISTPSLHSLAAMKAFALGRRAKWKDYVDLYFIIKDFFSVKEISNQANNLFDGHFSEKLFREQLAYHKDIDYSEEVEFLPGFETGEDEIKTFLIDKSLEIDL
jgi:hypothetical protein